MFEPTDASSFWASNGNSEKGLHRRNGKIAYFCTLKSFKMGKLAFILQFILSVFPADALENRRHIHVVRRGSKIMNIGTNSTKALTKYLPERRFVLNISNKGESIMCKFKDTTLGIKKLDFSLKRGAMAVFLTDGRVVIVPVSMFPDIKRLTKAQREDYMIMDDQYFSFENLSRIFSVKDVLSC
jgi:hypothetical protein